MLSKIKSNPFACVIWLMVSFVIHIVLFKSKVNYDYQLWQRMLTAIVTICLTLPAHELIHFIFMKMFCNGRVSIKIIKSPIGLPTLATIAQGEFQKWQLVIMYLAPFVFMTLLFDVIFAFCTRVELIFYVIAVCNSAGCFYDVFDALIAVRCEDGDRNGI